LPSDALGGPAYTLSASGTALMFELGAQVRDSDGQRIAPVVVVLETDSRNPSAKHQILEMYVQHGLELPDTPTMAVHRGRIDLLEEHLRRDANLLSRTFRWRKFTRRNSDVTTRCLPRMERRSRGQHCCICASITTKWRLRGGCSSEA